MSISEEVEFDLILEQAKQEGESVEDWNHFNEEHFLRLAEEFHELMKKVKLRNPEDYFIQFIR
jgi:hypothetical protein